MNLLPIPVLNGGHIILTLLKPALGKHYESISQKAAYVALAIMLLANARLIIADLYWLQQ